MKKCCVVIVTYNAEKWVDVCLGPLVNLPKDMSVVVVDNLSSDMTVDIIKKKSKFVKLFETGENLGFGRANNVGIQWAYDNGFEHIFLLNQDACIGCGMCLAFAEAVFAYNADGKVENVLGEIPADFEAAVEEAAANCPAQAIEVE